MINRIQELMQQVETLQACTLEEVEGLRIKFLSKKGIITELFNEFRSVPKEEKAQIGQALNRLRQAAESKINGMREALAESGAAAKSADVADLTRTPDPIGLGTRHPLSLVREQIIDIFSRVGFTVAEGPEVEDDNHVYSLLNFAPEHPARDMQDTFYINPELLLRSQTSPVQVRTMLAENGKPIKIICPGKVYRRDADDATHSHQFMQIEGLLVDKNIRLSDLKGTFDTLAKKLFGEDCKTRFRPSYYQFTEPSVETDISCFVCKGKGCSLCKNTGWITVSGAGMVHPNVLRNCGYDPKVWSGFAFGFGAERLAMLKYGINDIRTFYQTDLRESKTFDRREV